MSAHTHDIEVAGDEAEIPPIRQFKMVFQTFAENQEELLHVARYICARQSDLDDAKSRRLGELSRKYPELSYEALEKVWDVVEQFVPVVTDNDDDEDAEKSPVDDNHSEADNELDDPPVADNQPVDENASIESGSAVDETAERTVANGKGGESFTRTIADVLDLIPEDYLQPILMTIFDSRNEDKKHSPRVLSSLLVNAFTEFEVLVSNLFTALFNQNELAAPSAAKYSWKDVAAFGDLDEFKAHVIDDAVTSIMYGGYEAWLADLKKHFGIVAPSYTEEFSVLEVIQRRHVIVHNASYVSQQYVDKLAGKGLSGVTVGDQLLVDEKYLVRAADLLFVTALCLTEAAARKIVKKDVDALRELEEYVGNQLYELLQQRRYDAIADFAVTCDFEKYQSAGNALVCKVNYWLALKRLGQFQKCRRDVKDWDTDILGKEYKLARLALLDEKEEALELVREIRGTDQLPTHYWATWPLLEELRAAEIELAKETRKEAT